MIEQEIEQIMRDNLEKAVKLSELVKLEGWQILIDLLKKYGIEALEQLALTLPSDTAKIMEWQVRARAYKYLEFVLKEIDEKGKIAFDNNIVLFSEKEQ